MIIGIVGKPNVGKSTFFKALTLAEVAIAPYPFTTIDKNEGVAFVKTLCPEREFGIKCKSKYGYCNNGYRFVPVKIIDVAGLVPGAHLGKGRGNKFLDDLREADVLIHVIDASGRTNEEGNPAENYNICYDARFLEDEIDRWLYAIVIENWQAFVKKVSLSGKNISEEIAKRVSGLKIKEEDVNAVIKRLNLSQNATAWNEKQIFEFVRNLRKISKPIIIAANKFDLPESQANFEKLKQEFVDTIIISCSAECELTLREAAKKRIINYIPGAENFEIIQENFEKLSEQQKKALLFLKEYLKKYGNTGIEDCINIAVYKFLRYITIYPVENENKFSDSQGNILPDALLMPLNSTALDLAFAIHTDIGKNFISAIDARTKKRLAKDYKLKDKDVIRILTRS